MGIDVIVVQGCQAGDHVRGVDSVDTLLGAVVPAVAPTPVLAAGGIADAQAVAGALARGAAGVWVGTRFVASHESAAHPLYKRKLLESTAADTVLTTLFDLDWPNAAHRVLRNSTVRAWEAGDRRDSPRRPGEGEIIARLPSGDPVLRYSDQVPIADTTGDVEAMALYAGTGVGSIHDIRSAGEILFELAQATR
jgi:NAD(P)H-dependent flavin oxidoreductase YrpB (nitropropane dioxygenase family)